MITVSIVEDDATFAGLLVWALSKHKDIRIAGKYPSAEDALREIPQNYTLDCSGLGECDLFAFTEITRRQPI